MIVQSKCNTVRIANFASNKVRQRIRKTKLLLDNAETAMSSVRPLVWMLHVVLYKADKLHILCHSMGSKIVMEAIKSLSHDYSLLKKLVNQPSIYEKKCQRPARRNYIQTAGR